MAARATNRRPQWRDNFGIVHIGRMHGCNVVCRYRGQGVKIQRELMKFIEPRNAVPVSCFWCLVDRAGGFAP